MRTREREGKKEEILKEQKKKYLYHLRRALEVDFSDRKAGRCSGPTKKFIFKFINKNYRLKIYLYHLCSKMILEFINLNIL